MIHCSECGGKMRHVHRRWWERFVYLAIYVCRECQARARVARPFTHHFGPCCRCPRCGAYRLTRLKRRDHIDRMQSGFLNLLQRLAGGHLLHCRACRLQFYDRRPVASHMPAAARQEMGAARK